MEYSCEKPRTRRRYAFPTPGALPFILARAHFPAKMHFLIVKPIDIAYNNSCVSQNVSVLCGSRITSHYPVLLAVAQGGTPLIVPIIPKNSLAQSNINNNRKMQIAIYVEIRRPRQEVCVSKDRLSAAVLVISIFQELSRRHAVFLLKCPVEIGEIMESHRQRDLQNGSVSVFQQFYGFFQTQVI